MLQYIPNSGGGYIDTATGIGYQHFPSTGQVKVFQGEGAEGNWVAAPPDITAQIVALGAGKNYDDIAPGGGYGGPGATPGVSTASSGYDRGLSLVGAPTALADGSTSSGYDRGLDLVGSPTALPESGAPAQGAPDIANWRNMTISQIRTAWTPQQMALLPVEALSQFPNDLLQTVIDANPGVLGDIPATRLASFPGDALALFVTNLERRGDAATNQKIRDQIANLRGVMQQNRLQAPPVSQPDLPPETTPPPGAQPPGAPPPDATAGPAPRQSPQYGTENYYGTGFDLPRFSPDGSRTNRYLSLATAGVAGLGATMGVPNPTRRTAGIFEPTEPLIPTTPTEEGGGGGGGAPPKTVTVTIPAGFDAGGQPIFKTITIPVQTVDLGNGKMESGFDHPVKGWVSLGESTAPRGGGGGGGGGGQPSQTSLIGPDLLREGAAADIARTNAQIAQINQQMADAQQKLAEAQRRQDFEEVTYWQTRADNLANLQLQATLGRDKLALESQLGYAASERGDLQANLQRAQVTGYYGQSPTLAREQAINDELRKNFALEEEAAMNAANIAIKNQDFQEAKRQFGLAQDLREQQFELEQTIQTGGLDLQRQRFGLESELGRGAQDLERSKFQFQVERDPASFAQKAYAARGQTSPASPGSTGLATTRSPLSFGEIEATGQLAPGLSAAFAGQTGGKMPYLSDQSRARLLPIERQQFGAVLGAMGEDEESYEARARRYRPRAPSLATAAPPPRIGLGSGF